MKMYLCPLSVFFKEKDRITYKNSRGKSKILSSFAYGNFGYGVSSIGF